jgi:hypothetical protein
VVVAVVAAVVLVAWELCFVSYTRCDLILYANVKPPLGLTKIAVVALTRKRCNLFHHLARMAVQCRV